MFSVDTPEYIKEITSKLKSPGKEEVKGDDYFLGSLLGIGTKIATKILPHVPQILDGTANVIEAAQNGR